MFGRGRLLGASLALILCAAAPARADQDDKADAKFKARYAALVAKNDGKKPIVVKMRPGETPDANAPTVVNVAGGRVMPGFEPEILTPEDMLGVVNEHMVTIRACLKKQLAENPDWRDDMILDIAIRKSGRVAEVSISPGRVRRSAMGQCLLREVASWEFPPFTGEVGDGIVQEVVNGSFPFSFSGG